MSRKPGFKIPGETRAKMSAARIGRPCSEEAKIKIGNANRGRVFSDESRRKMSESRRREKSYRWKGGRHRGKNGYWRVSLIGDDGRTYTRLEHVVIAEKALGRRLRKGEMVHHINGDKEDNRNQNLLICTSSYHKQLEARMVRAYQAEHFA